MANVLVSIERISWIDRLIDWETFMQHNKRLSLERSSPGDQSRAGQFDPVAD